MFYVSYDKPAKIPDALMDKAVAFASEFLDIDGEMEVLFDGEFNDGCMGYVEYDPEDLELCVYVDGKNRQDQILTTFFHEMVHVKQYLKGELISGVGNKPSRWNGKAFKGDYYNLPWEQEAFELEKVMFDCFKSYTH